MRGLCHEKVALDDLGARRVYNASQQEFDAASML
jgi:hypothetical protein